MKNKLDFSWAILSFPPSLWNMSACCTPAHPRSLRSWADFSSESATCLQTGRSQEQEKATFGIRCIDLYQHYI